MFSRPIILLNNFGGVKKTCDGDVHSYRHNATNCVQEHDRCSDDGVVVCVGIYHDGSTALMRVNGALNAQIYWNDTTGISFSMTLPGIHCTSLPRFSTANNFLELSRPARSIPNRMCLR